MFDTIVARGLNENSRNNVGGLALSSPDLFMANARDKRNSIPSITALKDTACASSIASPTLKPAEIILNKTTHVEADKPTKVSRTVSTSVLQANGPPEIEIRTDRIIEDPEAEQRTAARPAIRPTTGSAPPQTRSSLASFLPALKAVLSAEQYALVEAMAVMPTGTDVAIESKSKDITSLRAAAAQRPFSSTSNNTSSPTLASETPSIAASSLATKQSNDIVPQEAVNSSIGDFAKQVDVNRVRCMIPGCTKVFRGKHFWTTHVRNRHPEWLDDMRNDVGFSLIYGCVQTDLPLTFQVAEAEKKAHVKSELTLVNTPARVTTSINETNRSIADSFARQREILIGEHVSQSRFRPASVLGEKYRGLTLSQASNAAFNNKTTNSPPRATINPFGAPRTATSRPGGPALPAFLYQASTSSDAGATARAQYGHSVRSERLVWPPVQTPITSGIAPETTIPSSLRGPTRRITPIAGKGPSLPVFLQNAASSSDPGAAARRQYSRKGADSDGA